MVYSIRFEPLDENGQYRHSSADTADLAGLIATTVRDEFNVQPLIECDTCSVEMVVSSTHTRADIEAVLADDQHDEFCVGDV